MPRTIQTGWLIEISLGVAGYETENFYSLRIMSERVLNCKTILFKINNIAAQAYMKRSEQ